MEIIILPGNSLHNKKWAEELAENLKSFGKCHVQNYRHWENGEKSINFEYEISRLVDNVKDKKEYILVGKSAGSIAILEALSKSLIKPIKSILMGLPVGFVKENGKELQSLISLSESRKEFIQNKNDPYGSAELVKSLLNSSGIKNYSFTETEGNTHDYLDFSMIKNLIK